MSITETSRYIALILRHKPETIDIKLDSHGWASVDDLIRGVSKTHPFTMEMLEMIVEIDDKQRFAFNEDKTLIRANQGHSISVDVELKEMIPPKVLYHGTAEKYVESIEHCGLIPKSRLYVHLSETVETATKVGACHGKPVIYSVDAEKMTVDGFKFYLSVSGVWLTKSVPVEYLEKTRVTSKEKNMTDERLEKILKSIDLNECEPIINNHIYYLKKLIKSRVSRGDGTYRYSTDEYEFLIITAGNEKRGIILRCGTTDLHWLVLREWRDCHVLSDALRTGVINYVWPENKTVSCCYSWRDKVMDRPKKYSMTKHLAELAGLEMKN